MVYGWFIPDLFLHSSVFGHAGKTVPKMACFQSCSSLLLVPSHGIVIGGYWRWNPQTIATLVCISVNYGLR